MRRTFALSVVAVVGILLVGAVAWSQQAPAPGVDRSQVVLSWDQFVKITGYDPAKGGARTLSIPWTEVESLLGVKVDRVGKEATVDLPWSEFKALLEWSMKQKEKPEAQPPTDFIVTSANYTGTLSDEKGDFELKMKIDVLQAKGWKRIPALPSSVAITKTTLPKGVYLNATENAYELLVSEAGSIDVTIDFAVATTKEAGMHRLDFQRMLGTSSVVDLKVDGTDVDVKLANAQALTSVKEGAQTHVVAALPGNSPVSVSWQRAIPKAPPAAAKLYAETRTLVGVADGVLLCSETVEYNVLHSGVREFKLKVPKGASVMTVGGRDVEDWRVSDAGELTVVLHNEVTGGYSLQVSYEQPASGSVEVPVIRATGVERERGYVGVAAIANVEIASGVVTGATEIEVRRLPPQLVGMTDQPILLGYRYIVDAFSIPLTIKKHGEVEVLVTIVDGASFTAMQLSDGRRITRAIYQVRNNRNQFLRLQMPEGAELWSVSVSGRPASPAKDEKHNVLIPLVRSRAGTSDLASFPVELVFIETPAKAPAANGTLHVELPTLAVPAMQVMYTYYLPAEGIYPPSVVKSLFKGTLHPVESFATLASTTRGKIVYDDSNAAGQELQSQMDQRVQTEAAAAGSSAIRVRLPLNGKQYYFERILALPSDKLWFEFNYSNWQVE